MSQTNVYYVKHKVSKKVYQVRDAPKGVVVTTGKERSKPRYYTRADFAKKFEPYDLP